MSTWLLRASRWTTILSSFALLVIGFGWPALSGASNLHGQHLHPTAARPATSANAGINDDPARLRPFALSATPTPSPDPNCLYQPINILKYGGATFRNPPVLSSANGVLNATLRVTYTDPATTRIGGCPVHLRSYGGNLIGPTLRVKPGDTIRIHLINDLPPNPPAHHENIDIPHDFNTTNVHTHGLHVSPVGNSDNVLLSINPGQDFQYEIKVPYDQPSGTFWYHAHSHGSVALQVSSGLEGALIVESTGVDRVPQIAKAKEQIFMLQQIPYDQNGRIESYDPFAPGIWQQTQRQHTINGQLFPVITMAPGEVQRWRFIHGGDNDHILVELRGPDNGTVSGPCIIHLLQCPDISRLPRQDLHEIAVDGIALGHLDTWKQIDLEPGYRSDVLVSVNGPGVYYLYGDEQPDGVHLRENPSLTHSLRSASQSSVPYLLAKVVVSGPSQHMALPTDAELQGTAPFPSLLALDPTAPIAQSNTTPLTQENPLPIYPGPCPNEGYKVQFLNRQEKQWLVCAFVDHVQEVSFSVTGYNNSPTEFLAGQHSFGFDHARTVKLGSFDEWVLTTPADSTAGPAHAFHIHTNPFETWRYGPDGKPELIWRDTVVVVQGQPRYIFTRYRDYIGTLVYHCHILDHEDQGMMELVNIKP